MNDLAVRINASLKSPTVELWFPELTAELTRWAWDSLNRDIGLTPDSYGTERILSRNTLAPRHIIASLETSPPNGEASTILVEALTRESARKYQERGIDFYTPDDVVDTTARLCLEEALALINQVPSLMRTIATLVWSLHLIKPEDADHDVSFSEPEVPFSIFVSVPQERIANDTLRVAEAIIHEAMHLQLTLIERVVPFFSSMKDEYFSPWREELRNSQGLLHALYVFRVIDVFFHELLARTPLFVSSGFVEARRWEIRKQVIDVGSFHLSQDLTPLGKCFARKLLHRDNLIIKSASCRGNLEP